MKKKMVFDFDDESKERKISYSMPDEGACLDVDFGDDQACIYGNRKSFKTLAEIFSILASCDYPHGFHIHLRKDLSFDASDPDVLRIVVKNS